MMKINKIKSYISRQYVQLHERFKPVDNEQANKKRQDTETQHKNISLARKAGITAIELSVVLVLLAVGATYGVTHYTQYINHQVTQSAADHLQMLTEAVSNYTLDNRAALATTASTSPGYITTISETALRSGGYLRSNESLTNPLGQTYQVLVKGSATSATDQKIMPFIVSDGNDTLAEPGDARRVANAIGGTAGFTTAEEPETIRGTNNLWEFDVAQWGLSAAPERIASAVFYDDGVDQVDLSGLLHRNYDASNPALNTMNTAINMNGNNLQSVNHLEGNTANLSNSLSVGAGGISSAGNVTSSSNVVASAMYSSNWFRSQGQSGWYSETYGGGWYMTDSTWIRAYGNKNIYTPGTILGGSVQSSGRLSAGEYVQINGIATEGWGCAPNGLVGRDAAGLILSCQSGIWRKSGNAGPETYTSANSVVNDTGWITNYSGKPQAIMARTDAGVRDCFIAGEVLPWGLISSVGTPVYDYWSNQCAITFVVPPGRQWRVSGSRKGTNVTLTYFTFTF